MPRRKGITFHCDLKFNKETYTPGDIVECKPIFWNDSNSTLRITAYQVIFDWLKTKKEKEKCKINTDAIILPRKFLNIKEKLVTKIPLTVDTLHHSWVIKFYADLKVDGDWDPLWESEGTKPDKILIKPAANKNYKIFVSHRVCQGDEKLVDRLNKILRNNGFTPFIIEKNPQTHPSLWSEIEEKIYESDCFLLLWTRYATKKPGEIREELGKANLLGKHIICLSETKNIPSSISDIKYTHLNRKNLNKCIEEILESIIFRFKTRKKRRK